MNKLFKTCSLVIILLLSALAYGVAPALTTVSATLTDTSGQAWINGTWHTELIPPFGNPNRPQNNGNPTVAPQSGTMDGTGAFSVVLDDNLVVTPSQTQTKFVLCPNASVATCTTVLVTVTGVTQNLTATLSAALIPVTVSAAPTLTRAYASTEVTGGLGSQYANVLNSSIYQCTLAFCNGTGWNTTGATFVSIITTSPLPPTFSPQGALALLYPPSLTVPRGLYEWNGTNWYNTSPYNADADMWACPHDGTDAQPCFDNMINNSIASGTGQSINLPLGVYTLKHDLHIKRNVIINGQGGFATVNPSTVIKLAPGYGIYGDKSTFSASNGGSDWSIFRTLAVVGTSMSCTGSTTTSVLTSCNQDPTAFLTVGANDFITGMGFNGTGLWGVSFLNGTTNTLVAQVTSVTANSITMSGGLVSRCNCAITIMKAGNTVSTGDIVNGNTTITNVVNAASINPNDLLLGPGLSYPCTVITRNSGTLTLTISCTPSASNVGATIVRGPVTNVQVSAGSLRLEDTYLDTCAGDCYFNIGSFSTSPTSVADGNYINYLRVTHAGNAGVHFKGADSNTATTIGVQGTANSNGCILDESFLGNTHIGAQCASGEGIAFLGTGLNQSMLWLNDYVEGGQKPLAMTGNIGLAICGANLANIRGATLGNYIGCDGRMSPNFQVENDQGGLTAATRVSALNASPVLFNTTNEANFNIADPIVGAEVPATTLVNSVDTGAHTITMNKNAIGPVDVMPVSQVRVLSILGDGGANGNAIWTKGYSHNASSFFTYALGFVNNYSSSASIEMGDWCDQYRGSFNAVCLTTDDSKAAWDYNGTNASNGQIVFPATNGITIGALANKIDIREIASNAAPTTGNWRQGSIAIAKSTTGGLWQQITTLKTSSGAHIDITAGSTALVNPDAAFTNSCAPDDSITGTGIKNATTLTNTSTLSLPAKATTATLAVTCTRLLKAHVATLCDLAIGTNTALNCTTISGWAANDTIRTATGIPSATYVTVAPSGTTITMSQNATSNQTQVPIFDAAFQQFVTGPRPWQACNGKGLGDGVNPIAAATYPQFSCYNDTGSTVTISNIRCYTDNNGTSTLDVKNNAGTSFLTGVITCNNTKANGGAIGTLGATITIPAGISANFTFVADGTSKQTNWTVDGTF